MIVVLVDNQPICVEALSSLIASRYPTANIRVAGDRVAAAAIMDHATPDLVIVEASLPDLAADADLRALIDRAAPAPVLILDGQMVPSQVQRARALGARGYVAKTASRDLLDASIALVAAGGEYFPPVPVDSISRNGAAAHNHALSGRQVQVLEQIMLGKANREIAIDLGISAATVKLHVHAILKTTGARNRTEAALLGRDTLHLNHGGLANPDRADRNG